jgi:hypothetical protein
LSASGQAGAQFCDRKPPQVPLGRVGGPQYRNLDTTPPVNRYDLGGRPDDCDLKIDIVRFARRVVSHGNLGFKPRESYRNNSKLYNAKPRPRGRGFNGAFGRINVRLDRQRR